MSFVQILFVLVLWMIPIAFLMSIYLKISKKDQQKLKSELKRPAVFLGLGIPMLGLLSFVSGFFSSMKVLQHLGAFLLLVSWIVTSYFSWRRGKSRAAESLAFLLLGVAAAVGYNYIF